jgi:hypothetical protein
MAKTLFILGAGASAEFGYHFGKGFKDEILKITAPNSIGHETLIAAKNSPEDIENFRHRLEHADIDTIDEFIEELHDLEHVRAVGRQAIALAISFNEPPNLFNLPSKGGSWLRVFRDYLRKNKASISSNEFSFLTFNYDISFEHYLYTSLVSASSDNMARRLQEDFLGHNNFVHLHGRVGYPQWMTADKEIKREHRERITGEQLRVIGTRLLLPHEQLDTGILRERIMSAHHVVLLGFGFHPHNMHRIFLERLAADSSSLIFATVYGLEADRLEAIIRFERVRKYNVKCRPFMVEFLRRLDNGSLKDWASAPILQNLPVDNFQNPDPILGDPDQ